MKTYLYSDLINQDYYYNIDNNEITIFKDCNNNSCTCEKVLIDTDYMRTNTFSCTYNNDNNFIYNNFSDNIYYRLDFYKILIIFIIFCFFIIYCPIKILLRFFKRFN